MQLRNFLTLPLQRMQTLACCVPYALEGMVRRELDACEASLMGVEHAAVVTLRFKLPEAAALAAANKRASNILKKSGHEAAAGAIADGGQGRAGAASGS